MHVTLRDKLFSLIDGYASALPEAAEVHAREIWREFGTDGVVFALDMSGFTLSVKEGGILPFLIRVRSMQLHVTHAIERNLGQVIKSEADNLFAVFETPLNAARAAVAIMNLGEKGFGAVSIGLSQGRFLLMPREDLYGDPVNNASKLAEDFAGAGQTLVDSSLLCLKGNEEFKLKPHVLPDNAGSLRAFALSAAETPRPQIGASE